MTDPPQDTRGNLPASPWAAVSPALVDRLLLAIQKPPLERPSPENLGLDSQALRPFAQHLAGPRSCIWADDRRRLRRVGFSDEQIADLLSDVDALPLLLQRIYRGAWTDDYPQMEVRLRMRHGERDRAGVAVPETLHAPLVDSTNRHGHAVHDVTMPMSAATWQPSYPRVILTGSGSSGMPVSPGSSPRVWSGTDSGNLACSTNHTGDWRGFSHGCFDGIADERPVCDAKRPDFTPDGPCSPDPAAPSPAVDLPPDMPDDLQGATPRSYDCERFRQP